jgi:hypothetical protein
MARELGEYRDAHLEIEDLVRKAGPVLETFVSSTVGPSALDHVKASGGAGHRGDVNTGSNRNAMRGAQLQMKPPSER